MSAPEELVDHRDVIREYVRSEVAAMERRRAELKALLVRTGLDYVASTFEMHCPYCMKIGGGQCAECTSFNDGDEAPTWLDPRAWRLVDRTSQECWLWHGTTNSKGYATWRADLLHRLFFQAYNRHVDISRLVVHHTCRVKHCLNPAHLEALGRSAHGVKHYREANP